MSTIFCQKQLDSSFFFFFFSVLRRMGKNKALAHHTSTYFHTRRVSICTLFFCVLLFSNPLEFTIQVRTLTFGEVAWNLCMIVFAMFTWQYISSKRRFSLSIPTD